MHPKRQISLNPAKSPKQLKKLLNITSPNIKYAKICLFVLDKYIKL